MGKSGGGEWGRPSQSRLRRASSPRGRAKTVKKACHCEEAQRADVAIRFPRLGDGFPRRFAPRNDSLTLSVIIPYNGKVRQESLQFREPMTAGVVLFTKSSREGHDFAAIILYPMLVPNEMTYLFFLPLLFSNTHRQKTLTPPRSGSSVVLG